CGELEIRWHSAAGVPSDVELDDWNENLPARSVSEYSLGELAERRGTAARSRDEGDRRGPFLS
ncbi:MAG: hypothetical protein ACRET3_08425, partial [Burkholderiales bacterium]